MMNGLEDWLGRHDEGVKRELGVVQTIMGEIGVVDGIGFIAGGPIKIAAGLTLASLSAYATYEGTKRTIGTYQSTEGQRVLDALDLAAPHPGDRNRPLELATEAGIAAVPWAAGKLVNTGMHAFHGVPFFSTSATRKPKIEMDLHSTANAGLPTLHNLNKQLLAEEISKGHAFKKHVLDQKKFKKFGISSQEQFARFVENVIESPSSIRYYRDGRIAYVQESTKTVVFKNSVNGESTAFRSTDWKKFMSEQIAKRDTPYEFSKRNTPSP